MLVLALTVLNVRLPSSVMNRSGAGRRSRRWRTVSEKRRIAELTLEPGASVALVARAHGVNQVFKWRRALKRGELTDPEVAADCAPSSHVVCSHRHSRRSRPSCCEGAGNSRRRDSHRVSGLGH
jgi:transposase-like protein